eukprot:3244444-Amphidinium_carterae.2
MWRRSGRCGARAAEYGLLAHRRQVLPTLAKEAVEAATQQATVIEPQEAQHKVLNDWAAGRLMSRLGQLHQNCSRVQQYACQAETLASLECLPLSSCEVYYRDLGVDTQWASWRNPRQKKRISTFHQSMNRVHVLGLPARRRRQVLYIMASGSPGTKPTL